MTEIEIKNKLNNGDYRYFPNDRISEDFDADYDIEFLLTTIESLQRKVFIRDRIITAQEGHIDTVNNYLESLNSQIESLKAITELAVKRLKAVSTGYYSGNDCRKFTLATLEQIEKLQK